MTCRLGFGLLLVPEEDEEAEGEVLRSCGYTLLPPCPVVVDGGGAGLVLSTLTRSRSMTSSRSSRWMPELISLIFSPSSLPADSTPSGDSVVVL